MADNLPLLVFPRARTIVPSAGRPHPPGKLHFPSHDRQVQRLTPQLDRLQQEFARYRATVSGAVAGLEPETVLVIEIAGSVENFRQAVEDTDGLEWLGEWDLEDIQADDDFYQPLKIGPDFFKKNIHSVTTRAESKEIREPLKDQGYIDDEGFLLVEDVAELRLPDSLTHLEQEILLAIDNAKKQKQLEGRLFLSMTNQQGLDALLALWKCWERGDRLPHGKTKWRDVFTQTYRIRRWGIEEVLRETGMVERWRDLLDPVAPDEQIHCQIELFYRRTSEKRRQNEAAITDLLREIDGVTLSSFIDMPDIAFHAVKVGLPAVKVKHLLDVLDSPDAELDIQLFKFPGVMYCRPTGQGLVALGAEAGVPAEFPEGSTELPPVAAILDGVPNLQHDALEGRLLFDDPDNLADEYQPGERRHGTMMASLVLHGEQLDGQSIPLSRLVYHLPVMQPNPESRGRGFTFEEHFPDDIFFEDRMERAVRRMFEGEGDVPAQAPSVKIINLSICDPTRPFLHTPSPWARLLDWLSWKYCVLFCVSAGNYSDKMDIGISDRDFAALSDQEKVTHVLKCIDQQLSERRLLSPAESLNALTVGAVHADESGDYTTGQRVDLLPNSALFSPISRFGHGFRRSVKPEILFPGGRQLYTKLISDTGQEYSVDEALRAPGQQVAWDSGQEGDFSRTVHTRGTSNATALATRSGAAIHEVLLQLQAEHHEQIPDRLIAVLIKALLVHGAQHDDQAEKALTDALKTPRNSRGFRKVMARYIGYGAVNLERVLACTEQRGTVLGCGEIREDQVHEYRFPLPFDLSGRQNWRRMVITLAWFSPINPSHRNLREAKLEFQPVEKWGDLPLKLSREDSDRHQVLRGTVQHEVLEGNDEIATFREDGHILLHVTCKADATEKLDQAIPYGLAVTLEVAEGVDIRIYEQIRAKIRPQLAVRAPGG